MEKDNVKIGGGGGGQYRKIIAKIKQYSPFAFGTLKEVPILPLSALFTVIFYFTIVWFVRYKYDYVFVHGEHSRNFIVSQLNTETKINPNIVICGNSLNMSDINRSVLEGRMNTLSLNLSFPMMVTWVAYRQYEKFERFLDSPKILIINIADGYEASVPIQNKVVRQTALSYRQWYEIEVPQFDSSDLTLTMKISPTKMKLPSLLNPSLRESLLYSPLCNDVGADSYYPDHLAWNRNDFEREPEPELLYLFWAKEESFAKVEPLIEIENIAKRCKSKGILFVLNESPYCRPFANGNSSIDIAANQRREEWFRRLESNDNIVLIRSDEFYTIQKDIRKVFLYHDGHHMSYPGAVLYTHYLCDKLLSNKKFCKHLRIPYRQHNQTDFAQLITKLNLTPQNQSENIKIAQPLTNKPQ
jgi:hypothetical protein